MKNNFDIVAPMSARVQVAPLYNPFEIAVAVADVVEAPAEISREERDATVADNIMRFMP
jgi:hypothetical protein